MRDRWRLSLRDKMEIAKARKNMYAPSMLLDVMELEAL
jgi:hypothetical protein